MRWRLSDIFIFAISALLFLLFFMSGTIIAPFIRTGELGGGKLYQIIYNIFPFLSFIFIIIGAAIFSRDSFWKGTILGTLLVFPWIIVSAISWTSQWGNPFGNGSGGIGALLWIIIVIPAFVVSLVTSLISYKIWNRKVGV